MIPLRRRQHGQPAVARPAQRWIDRGLIYADLLTTYPANTITGQPDTITGTKVTTTPWGLARGFGTTVGVASTDRVLTTLSAHPLQRTWIIRSIRTGSGGGGLGRYFDVSSAVFLLDDNTTSRYQFGRGHQIVGFGGIARQGNACRVWLRFRMTRPPDFLRCRPCIWTASKDAHHVHAAGRHVDGKNRRLLRRQRISSQSELQRFAE